MIKSSESGRPGVQPLGLGSRFKHAARLLVLIGVALIATGLFAEAASASNSEPTLTNSKATFTIKSGNPSNRVWQLTLWTVTPQKLLGKDSGTSGVLVVTVPNVPSCYFQVDVSRNGVWYSGFKATVTDCGHTATTTTTTSSTTSTTTSTSTTKAPTTSTTAKPKTSGGHGGTKPTTGAASGKGTGPATKSATSVPSSKLAFTGVGIAMWIVALLGALLALTGSLLLVYARRYPRKV